MSVRIGSEVAAALDSVLTVVNGSSFPGYTEPNIGFDWHLCSDLRENSAGEEWMFFKC